MYREQCTSLYEFIQQGWHVLEPARPFVGGWAIEAMCDHLEAVTRGEITRLLINVPPGMMKSLLVSVFWPAWEWGPMEMPSMRYLASSYSGDLAIRDNTKMRRLVESQWYQMLWPEIRFAKDQNAKQKFANTKLGERECRAFVNMTGGRGDRVIIDDPHSVDGGESEIQRDGAVRTFREAITDRLNDIEKSAIVIIMQRLHQSDVSGTIMALKLPYVHLCLPMEYDPARHCETYVGGRRFFSDPRSIDGELLFPERFARVEIEKLKIAKGDYAYAGQYDQAPSPREGGMFKVDRLVEVESVPEGATRFRGWDIAGSTRKTSPWTVGALLAEKDGIFYIEHIARARAEIDEAENLIIDTARGDKARTGAPQSIPQDPGSSGKSQKHHLAKRLNGIDFTFSPETGAKEDRAIPFASQVNAGMVRIVRGSWNAVLRDEMSLFPGSTYKDQIDALSRAYAEHAKLMEDDWGFAGVEIVEGGAEYDRMPEPEGGESDYIHA